MKHESPHPLGESPSSGGMTTQNTTTVEIRENTVGTSSIFGWGWPDEALLSDSTEMARTEQTQRPIEDAIEYTTLYFVS